MTTPRVTEIAVAMAPVEPDPFIAAPSRASAAQRRLSEREARRPSTELVRRMLRTRAGRRARRLSYAGGGSPVVAARLPTVMARRAARGTPSAARPAWPRRAEAPASR